MGEILVGTSSWTDRTLVASGWYPPEANTPDARLRYYASQFPLVEVDATYYAPPAEQTARLWAERTPPEFTFNIKAFSLFTHHPTRPTSLPKDLRKPAEELGKRHVYLRDLDARIVDEMWERFLTALGPLVDAGKLGTILLQFPPWFPISRQNKQFLLACRDRCAPLPVCVEFRNYTWMTERNRAETLDFLHQHDLAYVCVDMPQGHTSSLPPVLAATASLAVMRFHGHSEQWTSNDVHERFRYRYGEDELAAWAPRLRELASQAQTTHVLMNNCYSDNAQVNAAQLMRLLS